MSATPTTPTTPTTTRMTDVLGWSSANEDALKQAVHQETQRTKIAQKILPIHIALRIAETVPSEEIDKATLKINGGSQTGIIETIIPFTMTETQVQSEQALPTALTLATRGANSIAIAQDLIVFQGPNVPLPQLVQASLNGNAGLGLLGENVRARPRREVDPDIDEIDVPRLPPSTTRSRARPRARAPAVSTYGENTFAKVAEGIAQLRGDGHHGPYALVLHSEIYADAHAPLEDTSIMPADRIRPMVEKGLYGTGTLPEKRGVLLSLGGNTMDLAVGLDATPKFVSYIPGNSGAIYTFQVYERFTLRLKDKRAVRRLRFL